MESSEFMAKKNLRKGECDEIIVDTDDRSEHGLKCYMQTGINLVNANYWIEIWFADGMKEPHIHIKNIGGLSELSQEEGTAYRKLFLQKFIPKEFWRAEKIDDDQGEIPDYSMCEKYENQYHPVAQENKPHHKYKTIKTLRSEFNKSYQNPLDLEIYEKVKKHLSSKNTTREITGDELYKKIASKISIIYLADQFCLKPFGKRLRICPFHADTKPSLSLNEDLGLFHCFGCRESGNIIKFYAMLKQLNSNFKIQWNQNMVFVRVVETWNICLIKIPNTKKSVWNASYGLGRRGKMKLIKLETLDIYCRGKYLATIGRLRISYIKVDFHLQTEPNSLLRRVVGEIQKIKKEIDKWQNKLKNSTARCVSFILNQIFGKRRILEMFLYVRPVTRDGRMKSKRGKMKISFLRKFENKLCNVLLSEGTVYNSISFEIKEGLICFLDRRNEEVFIDPSSIILISWRPI